MVAWAELLFEVGGFVLETAVDLFAPGQETQSDDQGSAPHLPLPETEYEERSSPPNLT